MILRILMSLKLIAGVIPEVLQDVSVLRRVVRKQFESDILTVIIFNNF